MEECRIEEIMIDQKPEKTLVLAYPVYYNYQCLGRFVAQFEGLGLKITEMRLMSVSEDFARKHLRNIEQSPDEFMIDARYSDWIEYLTSAPIFAMIVEGDNSVNRVTQLTSEFSFWSDDVRRQTCYASKSFGQAQQDIKFWFREDEFETSTSEKAVFILPTGKIHGPQEEVIQHLKIHHHKSIVDLRDHFMIEEISVLLIKPLAFRHCRVGQIIQVIESSSSGLRGLTLVRLTDSGSSGEMDGDGYGVAVVAFKPHLTIKPGIGPFVREPRIGERVDENSGPGYEIDSKYLQKFEHGQASLEAAQKFFKYGFSVWVDPPNLRLFGCIFEASVVGLESM